MTAGEPLDNGIWEIQFLDVGQADANLNITEEGELILIDADTTDVAEALNEALDGRVVPGGESDTTPVHLLTTHLHDDHVRGIGTLHDNGYEIQSVRQPADDRFQIRDPDTGKPKDGIAKDVRDEYVKNIKKHEINNIPQVSAGATLPIDSDTEIKVLAPPDTEESVDVTRPATGANVNFKAIQANENGAVYKLDGEQSALFMGDVQDDSHHHAESWLMQQHDDPETDVTLSSDILFAGHHGSGHATSEEFLDRADPEVVVISSGLNNTYTSENQHDGHPHDKTLERLHDREIEVYWTAGHGTLRTDLDADTAHPEPTTDLDTTNAVDLAALKYHCREHETTPEDVETLAPGNLPEETPEWAADAAPLVADTTEEIIDAAITNAETTADVYQTLKDKGAHPANRQLYMALKNDRTEHVTTAGTIRDNKRAYRTAKREQAAAQPSWRERVQSSVPLIPDPDVPEYNGPAPEAIDGPFREETIADAVTDSRTAKTMREDAFTDESPPNYLLDAEEHANTAVEHATNAEELFEELREHPGTHIDMMKAIETSETHLPEGLVTNERDTTQAISQNRSRDNDRGLSL